MVNNHPLKWVAFHRGNTMLYNNWRYNRIIGTHESVYRDSPIGNQETFLVRRISPLQQGFDCDILARISIGVHDNSTFFASEQGIICTTVSFTNSTAVVTELGCMPCIDSIQRNILVKASLDEILFDELTRTFIPLPLSSPGTVGHTTPPPPETHSNKATFSHGGRRASVAVMAPQ